MLDSVVETARCHVSCGSLLVGTGVVDPEKGKPKRGQATQKDAELSHFGAAETRELGGHTEG